MIMSKEQETELRKSLNKQSKETVIDMWITLKKMYIQLKQQTEKTDLSV